MKPWQRFPLIRIFPFFIVGIATSDFLPMHGVVPMILTGISLLMLFVAHRLFKSIGFQFRWVFGVLLMTLIFLLAGQLKSSSSGRMNSTHFSRYDLSSRLMLVRIIEPPAQKSRFTKCIVAIEGVKERDFWRVTSGKALVQIGKDDRSEKLFYGDYILIRGLLRDPQPNAFPHSFNQRTYLQNKSIFHISYLKSQEWKKIPIDRTHDLFRYALLIRNKLLRIFEENQVTGQEFAVAAALLLGYVEEVDSELMRDYSATGAMHILSVSGMHVGVIFLVLEMLLGFLRKFPKGMLVKTVLIIAFIWFYALLTGLSPAVMRASVMITLVVVGKAMKRQPDLLNIVAASCLFLLLYDPRLLMDVGFQLSYLAVIGIILLYKPIYDAYVTSRWIPDKIWSLVAVSMAAQLSTLPLTLYYFHQFPNYFLATNILVVPLSTLVIYTGMGLLFLGSVPFISMLFSKALTALVGSMNLLLHFIGSLPYAVTTGIYVDKIETIGIFLLILLLAVFVGTKKKKYLFAILVTVLFMVSGTLGKTIHRNWGGKMVFYAARDVQGVDCIIGRRSYFFLSGKTYPGHGGQWFRDNLDQTHTSIGVREALWVWMKPRSIPNPILKSRGILFQEGRFIQAGRYRVAVLDRSVPCGFSARIPVHILIITGNPVVEMRSIKEVFSPGEIIIASDNAKRTVDKWLVEAALLGLKCRHVVAAGPVVVEF
jgi:competence protein ComEC